VALLAPTTTTTHHHHHNKQYMEEATMETICSKDKVICIEAADPLGQCTSTQAECILVPEQMHHHGGDDLGGDEEDGNHFVWCWTPSVVIHQAWKKREPYCTVSGMYFVQLHHLHPFHCCLCCHPIHLPWN
jgi:hypothetical protein